ncbi:hypothetical protein U8527_12860 [Kordia algicida OT-1]|uniref:Uncharacterized protein n=1 Tax=Kordia algicida OT-1 TaxID=391587 RepID=A9ED95_9FLAO|nr:hypothetical protein [Kordia algicida]EDP94297.1 hypothetical protein KAOT1_06437 [Kordia algicida OT-1]
MKFLKWFKSEQKKKVNDFIDYDTNFENIKLTQDICESVINKKIPSSEKFYLNEYYISEGEYFRANEILFCLTSKIHGSGLINIKLPFSGKLEKVYFKLFQTISFDRIIFSITRIDDNMIDEAIFNQSRIKLEDTVVVLLEDEFTDEKTIKVNKVSSEDTQYFKLYLDETSNANDFLGLTLINHQGFVYISFYSKNEDITLALGDSLILLFEDKTKLNFTFKNAGEGTRGDRFNHAPIGFEELNTFLTKDLLKVKLISKRKNLYSIYHMDHSIIKNNDSDSSQQTQYSNKKEGQFLLKYMTGCFIEMNQKYKI